VDEVTTLALRAVGDHTMADTRQIVRWSLESKCEYREGERWEDPEQTAQQLADFRTLSRATPGEQLVDGICVTGWSRICPFKTPNGKTDYESSVDIPVYGFLLSDRLAKYGGADSVLKTCVKCEANALTEGSFRLGGCHGYFSVVPQSKELNEKLETSLAELGATTDFFESFQKTTPIWYGLWIRSPLRRTQARFLRLLFEKLFAPEDRKYTDIDHFENALVICENFDLPLHVSLTPAGHTDLGWHTVYPHCPTCKATALVKRWQDEYPQDLTACRVCGGRFKPADTHRSEPMNWDSDLESLVEKLGIDEYSRFVHTYVESQGFSAEQAAVAWNEALECREIQEKAAAANLERWRTNPSREEAVRIEEKQPAPSREKVDPTPCPKCGKPLRTSLAKQCFKCGADWH
jgi:hypothetical protein